MVQKITGKDINTSLSNIILQSTKITNEKDIANVLAENFAQKSSTKNLDKRLKKLKKIKRKKKEIKFQSQITEDNNKLFIIIKLQDSLAKSHDSATELDEIHYQLLKHFPKIWPCFLDIYNKIWIMGNMPTYWKQAIIILIRPYKLALTNCICKSRENAKCQADMKFRDQESNNKSPNRI